jgi:hypothetical protein
MKHLSALLFTILIFLASPLATAETMVEIISPAEGDQLVINNVNNVNYKVTLEGDDDHFFVFLDNKKLQLLRRPEGSYTFEKFSLGKHVICIKVAYKDHTLTGLQRCINIQVIPPKNSINYGNHYDN